jgi:uncharacterized protein with von Willebrand factor type A (vWA) domain
MPIPPIEPRFDSIEQVTEQLRSAGYLTDRSIATVVYLGVGVRAHHRPELFILCDVSDSVARFARFSLMLVHALSAQFTKVRSFVFVDTIDEVTRLFDQEDFMTAVTASATKPTSCGWTATPTTASPWSASWNGTDAR